MGLIIRQRQHPYARFMSDLLEENRRRRGDDVNEFAPTQNIGLALDVDESNDVYSIHTNLPGVSVEDINVNIHDDVLTISAEVKETQQEENTKVLVQERRFGKFSRSLRFPTAVNGDGIEASFDSGVLTIRVPKAEEAKPRQIPVMVGQVNS